LFKEIFENKKKMHSKRVKVLAGISTMMKIVETVEISVDIPSFECYFYWSCLIQCTFYYVSELETFRLLLTTYHHELDQVDQIAEEQALGILHLRFDRFKEAILPSPTELMSVVERTLPR
jgi:predicted xylose isomerase-like sugar epimerase